MVKLRTTILDLNDDCLYAIFDRLEGMRAKRNFSRTCVRFGKIFCNHYVHELLVEGWDAHHFESCLFSKFGHLMGSNLFPIKNIKTLKFDKTCEQYLTKRFFKLLKKDHPNVESVKLHGFDDKILRYMLPLPNLKKLHLINSYVTGNYMEQLENLEILILDTVVSFESVHLVRIVQRNKNLKKLELHSCPLVFSRFHSIEMSQNLNNLVDLEANWYELCNCQLVGNLPCLKRLVINEFKTFQCRRCRRIERGDAIPINDFYYGICECGFYDARVLFNGLRKKNILEELIFRGSRITTRDLTFLSKQTSLKTLFMMVENVPLYVSIAMFNNLRELEYIDMGHSWKLPMEALSFLEKCQKLKYIDFGNSEGFDEEFVLEAINVINRRPVPPDEPIGMRFINPDFDRTFLEDKRIKEAKIFIRVEKYKSSEMISRLYSYIYYF